MEKTYQHILVPLDGSKLSEVSLEEALTLSALSGAKISLLKVIEPIEDIIKLDNHSMIYIDEQLNGYRRHWLKYLHSIQNGVENKSIKINCVIETGYAPETIITYAEKHDIDIIVMATHGHSGLKRWVYGSVAEKVLRGANHPILLVRSYKEKKKRELSPLYA